MKFNSAICTSRPQSERLLALGLKKETADMTWKFSHRVKGENRYDCIAEATWDEESIQSYTYHCQKMGLFDHWKHPDGTQMSAEEVYDEITAKDIPAWSLHRLIELTSSSLHPYLVIDQYVPLYESLCRRIEWLIKEGHFNKEYLEE